MPREKDGYKDGFRQILPRTCRSRLSSGEGRRAAVVGPESGALCLGSESGASCLGSANGGACLGSANGAAGEARSAHARAAASVADRRCLGHTRRRRRRRRSLVRHNRSHPGVGRGSLATVDLV